MFKPSGDNKFVRLCELGDELPSIVRDTYYASVQIGPQTIEVAGGLPVDRPPKDIRCPEQRMTR